MQSTVTRGSAVTARGLNDLLGSRLAVSLVAGDQLSMHTGAGFDGNGFVGDIAADLTSIDELDAFAGDDVADHLAGDRNILRTNVAMHFTGRSDQDPTRLAIRLLQISLKFAIDAYALVDMKRALQASGVTKD